MAERTNGILLDSSAVIAHLRRRIDIFSLTRAEELLFVPLIALGELYKGAAKSRHASRNRQLIDEFMRSAAVLYLDEATAEL